MKIMLALVLLLLFCGVGQAQTAQTLDALSSGAPLGSNDIFSECSNGASCGTLKKAKVSDLDIYLNAVEARCANTTGDGAIIQTAVNTGKPVHIIGPCLGDTTVTVATQGQMIYGPATIRVTSVVSGNGTFACTTGGSWNTGPIWKDLTIVHAQTDTSSRASLINFKSTFFLENCFAAKLERIRIEECMTCVDAQGDTGQLTITDSEFSPISVGVYLGCLAGTNSKGFVNCPTDTVRLINLHIWPFGAELVQTSAIPGGHDCGLSPGGGTGLCAIWNAFNHNDGPQTTSGSAGPIGVYISDRADGVFLSGYLSIVGQGFLSRVTGGTPGNVDFVSPGFDSFPGIYATGGRIRVTGGYSGTIGKRAVENAGADIQVANHWFIGGSTGDLVSTSGGQLLISNSWFEGGHDFPMAHALTGSFMSLSGNQLIASTTGDTILCDSGSSCMITNNNAVSGGGGIFINMAANNAHRVIGNIGGGNSCPATQTNMISAFNGSGTNATCN